MDKRNIDMASKSKKFSPDMKLVFYFDRNPISNPINNNLNAFENLHVTDDEGYSHQNLSESMKRAANSAILEKKSSEIHKSSISRSDSYVTPNTIFFDTPNEDNNDKILNNGFKEKNHLPKESDTKRVLLTEQSHTSSESVDNSDIEDSSKNDGIIKKAKASVLKARKSKQELRKMKFQIVIIKKNFHFLRKSQSFFRLKKQKN